MLDRFIDQLSQRGLEVKPGTEPGQLLLAGPAEERTPEVMAALKAFKPQLLERYARPDPTGEARDDAVAADPKAPAPQPAGLTVLEQPHYCRSCNALILAVPDVATEAFCETPGCPYRRK
jgi:hypothetical protein